MKVKQLNQKMNSFFKGLPAQFKGFLAKFKKMSLGEQIAYGCIALGGLLIIISLLMF